MLECRADHFNLTGRNPFDKAKIAARRGAIRAPSLRHRNIPRKRRASSVAASSISAPRSMTARSSAWPDAKTGNELWRQKAADIKVGYSMTVAPLVADGVIIVGISGAEFGTRSFIDGWDPAKGKHLWRTHTIPTSDDCSPETIGQPRGRPADPYRSSRSRTDPRSHVTIEISKRTAVSFAAVAAMAIVQMTSPSASELPNARDDQVQIEHGKVTYAQKCSHCHGPTWSTQAPFARRARR